MGTGFLLSAADNIDLWCMASFSMSYLDRRCG